MGGLLAGIASLATPILARVLVALGMSVVTFGGLTFVVSSLKDQVIAGLGNAPLAMLQLAGLAGAWEAIGLVFGAMTFSVSYWALTKAVRIVGSGSSAQVFTVLSPASTVTERPCTPSPRFAAPWSAPRSNKAT